MVEEAEWLRLEGGEGMRGEIDRLGDGDEGGARLILHHQAPDGIVQVVDRKLCVCARICAGACVSHSLR